MSEADKQRHSVLTIDRHLGWKKGDGIAYQYKVSGPDAESIEMQ
jgi:hypothetical protein